MTTAIAARNGRLERLGAYSERDRADESYRRGQLAGRLRERLPTVRQYRAMERARLEHEAARRHAAERYRSRHAAYAARFRVILERVTAERRIKPAGKSVSSVRRYNDRVGEALGGDPEYRALRDRERAFDGHMVAIRRRCGFEWIMAGVLAVDDRATRRAKVRAWRGANEAKGAGLA